MTTPDRAEEAVDALSDVVEALVLEAAGVHITGVGLGLPGLVERRTGNFVYGPNFPVRDMSIAAVVSERVGLGVTSDNEGNAGALAEHRLGAGRGFDDIVYMAMGTGIAGGVIAGGRLLRGAHGWAGEFGHMLVDEDGLLCTCGRRGCWETVASGRALAAIVGGELGEDGLDASAPEVSGHLDGFASQVAIGLQNLVQAFDPSVIVLGGGLAALGDRLLAPIRAALDERLSGRSHREPPRVVMSGFGTDAALVGAALMAREEFG